MLTCAAPSIIVDMSQTVTPLEIFVLRIHHPLSWCLHISHLVVGLVRTQKVDVG